jgi:hypothetical protein
LDRTWQMLDTLDSASVDDRFTRTTVELAAQAAAEELDGARAAAPRQRRRRWLLIGGGVAAALGAGFLAVALGRPNPNDQLLRHLPVIENIDQYAPIQDIEFLRMLSGEKLFAETGEEAHRGNGAAKTFDERRAWIEALSPADKEQLQRRFERFQALSPAEQPRLIELHAALEHSPDAAQLRQTMFGYSEWLKAQPLYRRADLAELGPQQRVERVRKFLDEDAQAKARDPSPKDREKALQWLDRYAAKHEKRLLDLLPPDRRGQTERIPAQFRPRALAWTVLERWQAGSAGKPSPLGEAELAELRAELSPELRRTLESKPTADQARIIGGWVRREMWGQWGGRRAPSADEEKLVQFFEQDLSNEERDRLLGLSGEEFQAELRRMYFMRSRMFGGPGRPPEGSSGHHPRPPGDRTFPGGERPFPNGERPRLRPPERPGSSPPDAPPPTPPESPGPPPPETKPPAAGESGTVRE